MNLLSTWDKDPVITPIVRTYSRRPVEEILPRIPARNTFFDLDDAGRLDFANRWEELVLVADKDAVVRARYATAQPPETVEIASRVQVGSQFSSILNEKYRPFLMQSFQRAIQGNAPYASDYTEELPDGTACVFEFLCVPDTSADGSVRDVGVFLHRSIWEEFWLRYRRNVEWPYGFTWAPVLQFHTNNVGHRGEDVLSPKPPGTFRIACLGGSTTVEGLTDDLTYPAMLQKKLRDSLGTDRVEVINCGVFGIETPGEKKILPNLIALQPDLIVYYNFINDLREWFPHWIRPERWRQDPTLFVKHLARKSRFVSNHANGWLLPSDATLMACLECDIVANLRAMARQARDAGVAMAFCSFAFPDMAGLNHREQEPFDSAVHAFGLTDIDAVRYAHVVTLYNEALLQLCTEEHATYIPVAESFAGAASTFADVCHLNPAGIEHKAEAVFQALKEQVKRATRP